MIAGIVAAVASGALGLFNFNRQMALHYLAEAELKAVANYAVNCGAERATKLLQKAINQWGAVRPPLVVDGKMGPTTLNAAAQADGHALAVLVVGQGEAFYRAIGTGRQAKFLRGWLNRNRALKSFVDAHALSAKRGALA